MAGNNGPLLVFGPRSSRYDFGPWHPLTPRRFGPGIELLRYVGAQPALEPEPASDDEIGWLHAPEYVAAVKRFSVDPDRPPEAGIGPGDDPAFAGMHEAAATVAGGSLRAIEAILRGDVEHAYHPGGGLHHAMRHRASGFCIYNDPALAIARARDAGLRVLYVDLDVHHGDGVQALHAHDPGVLTISFHESGRTLFPGTGWVGELGLGEAAGTIVNVPLEPLTGPNAWLAAVRAVVPPLAAAFGPDVVVSQHGADSHVWDPLAHLSVTTSAMGVAAQLVDEVAHRHAGGRWLATGGGGYAIYRVVPRAWALTWLAGAHRDAPHHLPEAWRERWGAAAERFGDAPLPLYFDDEPSIPPLTDGRLAAARHAAATARLVRVLTVPALLRIAEDEGWWRPDRAGRNGAMSAGPEPDRRPEPGSTPSLVAPLTAEQLDRLTVAPRTIAPADPAAARHLLREALRGGATAAAAVAGEWLVGVAIAAPLHRGPLADPDAGGGAAGTVPAPVDQLAAFGVAPEWRGAGLGARLVAELARLEDERAVALVALITVAERDPIEPLAVSVRRSIAERLLRAAGLVRLPLAEAIGEPDPHAVLMAHLPAEAPADLATRIARVFGER